MARTVIQTKCPYCNKTGKQKRKEVIGDSIFITYECGHIVISKKIDSEDIDIVSRDGRKPFPFQIEGVKFLENADCNGLLLDEQGLGKTIMACMLLKRNPKDLLPCLIVVKSGLRAQWFHEVFRWTNMLAQVITGSREKPDFDLFDIVIVSIDTLRLLRPDVKVLSPFEEEEYRRKRKKLPKDSIIWTDDICARFKFVIIDESHKIKNPSAARTQALRKIVSSAGRVDGGKKARVLGMSGTNIEKHAGEFFVTLNLVAPQLFPSPQTFDAVHVQHSLTTGKPQGLRRPEMFRDLTKDFIIRRKREDVLPDLPKIFRQFRLAEMEGDELKTYVKIVKEFQDFMDEEEVRTPTDILGYLSKMRHITGIAKVNAAVEFVEEFLLESGESSYEISDDKGEIKVVTAGRKLVIFLHHKQAGAILMSKLQKLCKYGDPNAKDGAEILDLYAPPLYLSSDLDAYTQRPALVEEFKKPENRILIASTLASAEGLNMQFCSDCLIMERQWNPSIEEQAEGRFPRPGSISSKINSHYLIAAGTIDDFLTSIIEEKRKNVAQTLDGEEMSWDQDSIIMQLARVLQEKGLKKWSL